MQRTTRVLRALGMAVLLALSSVGCGGKQELQQENSGSVFLQSFEAETLDGGSFTQEDLSERDVTIFNFWALTCGPCIQEMPALADYEKSLPEHVRLVTVCLDGAANVERTKSVLQESGYEGITLVGGDEGFEKLCRAIMYTPTTLLIDRDGKLLGDAIVGGQKNLEQTYTDALNRALKSMGKDEI